MRPQYQQTDRRVRAGFNTASGMRSHATRLIVTGRHSHFRFQYRKRYEVTCDVYILDSTSILLWAFQYRKRYEVTCDLRSGKGRLVPLTFQYRKRYEVTCDEDAFRLIEGKLHRFNTASGMRSHATDIVMNLPEDQTTGFNTASGMRSHATEYIKPIHCILCSFNTASGMRSHATCFFLLFLRQFLLCFNTASGMRSHATRTG